MDTRKLRFGRGMKRNLNLNLAVSTLMVLICRHLSPPLSHSLSVGLAAASRFSLSGSDTHTNAYVRGGMVGRAERRRFKRARYFQLSWRSLAMFPQRRDRERERRQLKAQGAAWRDTHTHSHPHTHRHTCVSLNAFRSNKKMKQNNNNNKKQHDDDAAKKITA